MKNFCLRAALLLVGFGAPVLACNANTLDGGSRNVMFIRQVLAPAPSQQANGSCVYTSEPTQATLFSGTSDLGLQDGYSMTVLVQSTDGSANVNLSSAHVRVTEQDGTLIREFSQVVAGFVDASKFGVVSFTAIDAPTRDILLSSLPNRQASKTLVIHVDLAGTNPANGSGASAPTYDFPVRVCNGCLVDFSTGNDVTYPVQPNCLRPRASDIHMPCVLGQEEPVKCELCMGARPACDPQTP